MQTENFRKFLGHKIRRVLIAIFCVFVVVCTAFVMFHSYVPSKNNLEALSSVCMDIICIIILIILIGSFVFDNYGLYHTTRLFAGLLVATTWAVFLDFLNWAFDGSLAVGQFNFWFTAGSLCMGAILAGIFSLYLYSYMEETHRLSKMRMSALICAGINVVSFVITFVLAVTGTAFTFVDGHYQIGALYDIVTIIPVLTLIYLTGFVIRYTKKVGLHDVFAAAGYIFFMIFGALVEATYSIGTTYVSVAIADVFIFVMLQNEIITQEKRNVQKWMKQSNTDELTGFLNRHAYEAEMRKFVEDDPSDDFVYVSMDVNGLKTVNDSFGHNAGDELLVGASECMKKCFGEYGKIYRIGGDEFIALIYADAKTLKKIKTDIEVATANWHGKLVGHLAVSCGYVTREEKKELTVKQMAVVADRRMYDAKAKYYKSQGVDRRRK